MFPYFHILYFQLGPVKIFTWGLFVSLGFLAAILFLIKKHPDDKNNLIDLLIYILLGSMLGARLFFVLFYSGDILGGLREFYKIWNGGMSSFGGFAGGTLAAYLFSRLKKVDFRDMANELVLALPLGLAIARIGCYLVNDHPGIKTNLTFLAVNYPDGARFDLGLLLAVFDAALFIYFLLRRTKNRLGEFLMIYSAGRYVLDFLRVGEPTFAGLIPSQYGSMILFAIGAILSIKCKTMKKISLDFMKSEKITKVLFYVFIALLVVNQLAAAFILLFKKINKFI
jgi:phosphatidylglycerol:prolipoprotein diacylglycerol transferase